MREPQVLDPWLQTYAIQWRMLARQWTLLAQTRTDGERAAKLRRAAGRALYATYEIDVFLDKQTPPRSTDGTRR